MQGKSSFSVLRVECQVGYCIAETAGQGCKGGGSFGMLILTKERVSKYCLCKVPLAQKLGNFEQLDS